MQGTQLLVPFHVPGTTTANMSIVFKAYRNMTLQHVSAVGSNDGDCTLAVLAGSAGTTSILAAFAVGDSGTPVEKTVADFASTNATGSIAKGDLITLTIDYDGAGGTAVDDLTIVLTLTEG